MIDKYITDVCKILNIKPPIVSYDTSHFQSETMLAQCNSAGTTIFIRCFKTFSPDCAFAIAHELRHIWQIRTDYEWFLSDYQTADKIDTETYNNQFAEIDANAFAAIIMANFFSLTPQWNGLSDNVINAINDRINIIIHELND